MPLQYQLIYFVTAFLNATIAFGVFFRRKRTPLVQAFAGFILSITGWVVSLYFFYVIVDPVNVILVGRANFAVAMMMAYFAFLFCALFPERVIKIPRSAHIAIASLTAVLTVLTAATDLVDQVEIVKGVSRVTEYGPLYGLYVIFFCTLCVGSIILLIYKYRKLKGIARRQILIFGAGWGVGFVWGTVTNIVIPALTGWYDIQHFGPLAALFLVAVTAYAVARHELLNVQLLAVEVFIVFLHLLFVINIALSPSLPHQILGAISLVLVMVLSTALLRNVRQEIQRRKELDELSLKLADANEHLKEMDQLKSEFISIASHQLRTPISVIKGYISLILEGAYGKVDGPLKDKLVNMNLMNERLVQMINNMLNVSRIEKNKIEYICGIAELQPIMEQTVFEMSFKAKQKGLSLAFDAAGSDGLTAYVDSEKLQEVLTNLVDNAIKYSRSGTITLRAKKMPKGKGVMIAVQDQGIGMDKATAAGVFQKFYRSDDPAVKRESGSGLGLYIVAIFIRSMGGDVWIEQTAPGKGTTVALTLPVDPKGVCLRPKS
ncbi:MAG TPA: ATP-binding protein [Candidatus Eisenbacteria bacterium]|nr:ATP-binding protein [Candidatus Eisenbacteria bacterium]